MNKIIVAKGLVKKYGNLVAVRGISFEVRKGEIFAMLGPNGAGKTTTVRMLTTLTKIDGGEAYVNGFDVRRERMKVKSSIGVVLDVSNLYDELTVGENLSFLARLYGTGEENVDTLVKEFNLPKNRKFGKLSSGYKRRVTIAAALIHDPPVVFMDEPTVALDVRSARMVREMIGILNKEGKTIFLTTHNMIEAETLPHRIAIINSGQIVAMGTRGELRKILGTKIRVKLAVEPLPSKLLRELERYNPHFDREKLVFETEDVDSFLEELFELRNRFHFHIRDISTELPSIEEVFLELTEEETPMKCAASCGGCPI